MTNEGPCEVCDGPDIVVLVGAVVITLLMLGCVYLILAHESTAKRKDLITLTTVVGSQFLTTFQMIGLGSLAVLWPEPFAAVVELGSLMNFRLEVLNLGCVVSASPLYRYVGTMFSFVLLIACMAVYHVLYVWVFRRGLLKQSTSTLFGAIGTIFMTVFISVSSSIFEPFHCVDHPNGEATMRAYGQIVCWNTDYGDEHQRMVVVGSHLDSCPERYPRVTTCS